MSDALMAPAYRRRATGLHACRAWVGALYCLAPLMCALLLGHPVVLVGLGLAVVAAGSASGCAPALAGAGRVAAWLGGLTLVINPLLVRDGLTVIARLGYLPPLGQVDITLEAVVSGGVLALRTTVVLLAGALFVAAVDPDEVLRLFRRVSYRSALTATLATRLVPILAADARRLDEAQRCRPDAPVARGRRERWRGHAGIIRAVTTGALERGLDVAATLEVRGYGAARRAPAPLRVALSRHDFAFGAAGLAMIALCASARLAGAVCFDAYPTLYVPTGAAQVALAAGLVLVYLLALLDRRGIVG